jgi:DNA sulfur modification protein DndC
MGKVTKTINTLKNLFNEGWIFSVGLSGKDSSCVAHCAVEALKQAKEENPTCTGILYLATTDTTIDNFEVKNFILKLHQAAQDYAAEYDLPIFTQELQPKLFDMPLVEYIGRGKLLRTARTSVRGRDCSIDWKVKPAQKFLKSLQEKYQTDKILSLSGTRDQESVSRAKNIAKRGETIDAIVKTDLGWSLAPIKDWSLNDVWALLGQIEEDSIESFIDIYAKELRNIYGAGNGGTCDIYFGNTKSNDKGCGSRFGCTLCSIGGDKDKSLENQISTDEATYGYMKPLTKLRKFMNDTLFDMERSRSLLGRDIKHGSWIKIGYNQYSLEYRKELLRYVLTMDANEYMAAKALGIAPRFELINYEKMCAIQYNWAREGGELKPAEAISIWHEVHTYGKRFSIPETSPIPFEAKELNFSKLNFISGCERMVYRYANLESLYSQFDASPRGLRADKTELEVFNCRQAIIDGEMTMITPFTESKTNSIDAESAEAYINESYFYLEEEGILDPKNEVCPSVIIKDMLVNQVITIRKGGMNRLHQDLVRAQMYNFIVMAKAWGSSSIVDSVILARSVTEAEFEQEVSMANNDQVELQMVMGF